MAAVKRESTLPSGQAKPAVAGKTVSAWALLRRFWPFARPYRTSLLIGAGTIPLITFFGVWRPLLLKKAVDIHIPAGDVEQTRMVALFFFAAVIGEYLASSTQVYIWQRSGHQIIHDVRAALFSHIMRLPARFFDKSPVGTLVSRATSDIEALSETLAFGVFTITTDVFVIGSILITMFTLDLKITAFSLSVAPLLYLIVRFFSGKLRYWSQEIRKAQGTQIGYLTEQLNGMTVLQLFGRQQAADRQFSGLSETFIAATKHANVFDALLFSVMDGISAFSVAILLWVAAPGVLGDDLATTSLTVGLLFAFVDYLQRIFVPIKEFSGKLATVQRAAASLDRIYSIFDEPIESRELGDDVLTEKLARWNGGLRVRDLRFGYQADRPILKGLSFDIAAGQVVAVVGRSGSGKTSLGRVLTRLYDGYEGTVELEIPPQNAGEASTYVELRNVPPLLLRRHLLLVQQDCFLFDDSIRHNVSLGETPLVNDDARLWQALETTQAADFVRDRGGLDTQVGARGGELSVGQGQLVAFARVAACQPTMLLLDEATASVDSATEKKVQVAIERLLAQRTVLVIAHRLSTIRHANRILVMRAGEIVEAGSHGQLMEARGVYYDLYTHGFEEEEES